MLDPWIDHQPLRLYNADDLAARVEAEGADLLIVESDSVKGPVLDLPLRRHRLVPGRPQQRRHRRRHREGHPGAPGTRAATPTRSPRWPSALLFAVNRGIVRADLDVRAGETYRDGTIPYQRFRAWQLAGQTAGHRRARRGRPCRRSGGFEGLGMKVISYDPFAPDATHSLDDLLAEADVVSMHAAVTPETHGHDRRRAVRRA